MYNEDKYIIKLKEQSIYRVWFKFMHKGVLMNYKYFLFGPYQLNNLKLLFIIIYILCIYMHVFEKYACQRFSVN